jgi:hypothetical protein
VLAPVSVLVPVPRLALAQVQQPARVSVQVSAPVLVP